MDPLRSLLDRAKGESAPEPARELTDAEKAALIDITKRDTDADWKHIGAEQPYWGVLTEPQYRSEALTAEAMDAFYKTGRDDIVMFADLIRRASDTLPSGARGLDFGCGVGRLTEAMTEFCDHVTGVDVAPGMLERARQRSGKPTYQETLPDGEFDWINSHIVFQHMPTAKGLEFLDRLLERLAPNGTISLQFPYGRGGFKPPHTTIEPLGTMQMFDYDLNVICKRLIDRGVWRMLMHPTNHDDHYGFMICGRRMPPL